MVSCVLGIMSYDIDTLRAIVRDEQGGFFDAHRPITLARAPLSLDLMGGSADFAGALALQWPLAALACVALQPDPEPVIRVRSQQVSDQELTVPLALLAPDSTPIEYAQAHEQLVASVGQAAAPLARAVVGCWLALMREEFVQFRGGARLLLHAPLPAEQGISAALALTAATLQALTSAYGIRIAARELALHCQVVAQRIGGMPVGAAIPATAMCANGDGFLLLHCQPCTLQGSIGLPSDLGIWGISVIQPASSEIAATRIAAAMGYRLIAEAAGITTQPRGSYSFSADRHWRGYLANISTAEFERAYHAVLPETLDGATFLERYGGLNDRGVTIDPGQHYAIRAATTHAIYEQFRARSCATLLRATHHHSDSAYLLGELLYQSHSSASRCGLVSPNAQRLVEELYAAGLAEGFYGARAGASNLVLVLGRADATAALNALVARCAAASQVAVFAGTAAGAAVAGTRQIP